MINNGTGTIDEITRAFEPRYYHSATSSASTAQGTRIIFNIGATAGQLERGKLDYSPSISSYTASESSELTESSTQEHQPGKSLMMEMEQLFVQAEEEQFEDGMESAFSKRLLALIEKHGDLAVKVLSGLVHNKRTSSETASEALRWLGQMFHPASFKYRFWLLSNALTSSSLRVRDGALLGLSFMDTTKAIPVLEEAAVDEKCDELRDDIVALLDYLKARNSGTVSPHRS